MSHIEIQRDVCHYYATSIYHVTFWVYAWVFDRRRQLLLTPSMLLYPLTSIWRTSLADGSMHALAHRSLRFVLVRVVEPFAQMLLFNAGRSRLES